MVERRTQAEIELTEHLDRAVNSHDRWRVGVLILSYRDEAGEARVAQGAAMVDRKEVAAESAEDMVKMVERLRGLANELEKTIDSIASGGPGEPPLELRRRRK